LVFKKTILNHNPERFDNVIMLFFFTETP